MRAKEVRRHVLLLTATVRPPAGARALARTDPAQRLGDYARALRFYLQHVGRTFEAVVFAENSGADLGSLRRLAAEAGVGDRAEFVQFDGLDHPPSYGRGYGEFRLIDHAMERSGVIGGAGEGAVVWKVTGRYIVRNIGAVVASGPGEFGVYCNARNWPMRWMDMYLMAWTRAGYERFLRGAYRGLREDEGAGSAEVRLRRVLDGVGEGEVVRRLRREPRIEGVRGYDGRAYHDGRGTVKYHVRAVGRWVTPWVWI